MAHRDVRQPGDCVDAEVHVRGEDGDDADGQHGFTDLALRAELLHALSELGYEEPTPIQREAIPPLLEGRDLLGQAATGTGKTAAFALPLLERMDRVGEGIDPRALILVPTRELAVQVSEAVHRYGRGLGARVLGAAVRRAQTGNVQTYLSALLAGAVLLAVAMVVGA